MLTETEQAEASSSGKTWGELLAGEPKTKTKTTKKTTTTKQDTGMSIFGGGGSIPGWPKKDKPAKPNRRKVRSRTWDATKAATYDRLRRKRRTWLRVFLFGDGKPAGAGWTPEKRSRSAKKAIKRRRRDSHGRLR